MTIDNRTQSGLGRSNRRAVVAEILCNGPIPRSMIAARTGLTNAAVSRITRNLVRSGIIRENAATPSPGKRGRRFVSLDVNPGGGFVLGIGFNVFEQTVTLADLGNMHVERRSLGLSNFADPMRVLECVADTAREVIAKHVADRRRLLGGVVAISGAVDPGSGRMRRSHVLGWGEVDVGGILSRLVGIPIRVENLANAINLAEARFGINRGVANLLLVNVSLGLGASLILDGRLVRSREFSAGLVGQMPMPPGQAPDDPHHPTLDDVAGGWGVLRLLRRDDGGRGLIAPEQAARRLTEAIAAAESGDAAAVEAITRTAQRLARAIQVFVALTHPERVTLAGALGRSTVFTTTFLDRLESFTRDSSPCAVLRSTMTSQTAARWLAMEEYLVNRDINIDDLRPPVAA